MYISKAIAGFSIVFVIGLSCKKQVDVPALPYYFSITIDDVDITITQPFHYDPQSREHLLGEIKENGIHLFANRSGQTVADSCFTFWMDIPTIMAGTYEALGLYFNNGRSYQMGPNGIGGTMICVIEKVEPYQFSANPGLIEGTFSGTVAKQQNDPGLSEILVDVQGRFSIPNNVE